MAVKPSDSAIDSKIADMEHVLKALNEQVRRLNDQVQRLEAIVSRAAPLPAAPAPPVHVVEDPQTLVRSPPLLRQVGAMPTDEEIDRLVAIVGARLPFLVPQPGRLDAPEEVQWAIQNAWRDALHVVPRFNQTPAGTPIDRTRDATAWLDLAGVMSLQLGRTGSLESWAFLGVCVALQVPHNLPNNSQQGELAYLGLVDPARGGRPIDPMAWKETLRSGQVPSRTEPAPRQRGEYQANVGRGAPGR